MDVLDHTEDEEEEQQEERRRYGGGGGGRGSRFRARRQKRRAGGSHQLLLMDCVGSGKEGASTEETVPLPEYERLSQSARLPDDTDPLKSDAAPPAQKQPQTPARTERKAQKPAKEPPSPPRSQQPKPAAWRLIEYVRSRNKSGGGGVPGCGSSDGDSKSSDGEKEPEDGGAGGEEGSKEKKGKKKRSSWLPDPDRRWPVQGFY